MKAFSSGFVVTTGFVGSGFEVPTSGFEVPTSGLEVATSGCDVVTTGAAVVNPGVIFEVVKAGVVDATAVGVTAESFSFYFRSLT